MRELHVRFFILVSLSVATACGDDATPLDASIPGDVGFDGEVATCETANDCSDGLFCTGEETCQAGVCVPGVVVDCDDGIECTIDGCNEIANRCESLAPDLDEDGSGDMRCVDALGEPLGRDCDDSDPRRFGGNLEVCDLDDDLQGAGLDEDCDATTFGAVDADGDNYFDARCFNTDGDGVRAGGDDCNDGRRDVNPAASETCDHVDNNCDGNVDEGVLINVAPDADRDGFPVDGESRMECPGFAGLVAIDDDTLFDCDDANPTVNPGQVEICDLIDNDCNLVADDNTQIVPWYGDSDGDGFGSAATRVVMSCEPVADTSILNTDCDDDNAAIHPAAAEACDGIDNDCNGRADYEITPGDFEDDDGDGSADIRCGAPRGVDCDDQDASTGGGTPESCDGRDNDCDDNVDEGATEVQWFYDGDRDGHGTNANPAFPPVFSCSPPMRYVGSGGDCNDMDAARSPDATEVCNSVDDDCDGALDEAPAICDCAVGTMDCDADARGICETRTDSNVNNCGGCGNLDSAFDCEMAPGVDETLCVSSRCLILECQSGFDDCSALPGCETNVATDVNNCGSCGNECVGGNVTSATCVDQQCANVVCEPGFVDCGSGQCNTPSDRDNCGACGRQCGPGQTCDADTCVSVTCLPPETLCGEVCENLDNDQFNCGSCGRVCPSDSVCMTGDCLCDTLDHRECGGSCVDTSLDGNCGGCGITCQGGQMCNDSRCTCDAGESFCDGACVETDSDPLNCGGCGRDCGIGGTCALGVCDPVIKMVQGLSHTCALRGGGSVVCWGNNNVGQVVPGTIGGRELIPRVVTGLPFAVDLSAGEDHTCVVTGGTPAEVWCWGSNGDGQLGRTGAFGQTILSGSEPPQRVYAGANHTCATTTNSVECWGSNENGESDGMGPGSVFFPTPVFFGDFSSDSVLVGSDFTCFSDPVEGQAIECIGDNGQSQSGSPGISQGEPIYTNLFDFDFVPGAARFSSGHQHSCGVFNGDFDCWGGNTHGQCDPTGTMPVLANDPLSFPFTNVRQCAARGNTTCVVTNNNDVWCAGDNIDQTLIPGDASADVPWTRVAALGNAVQSLGDGGSFHTCVISVGGRVFCWGRNDEGQVGTGSTSSTSPPTRIYALTP